MGKAKSNVTNKVEKNTLKNIKKVVTPNENDVLCGRGSRSYFHPGNKLFRTIVGHRKSSYNDSGNKFKPAIAADIIHFIQSQTPSGRFLSEDKETKLWYEIPFNAAVQKTQQALREKTKWTKNDRECKFIEEFANKAPKNHTRAKRKSFQNVSTTKKMSDSDQCPKNDSEVQMSGSVQNPNIESSYEVMNIISSLNTSASRQKSESNLNSVNLETDAQKGYKTIERHQYTNGHLRHELTPLNVEKKAIRQASRHTISDQQCVSSSNVMDDQKSGKVEVANTNLEFSNIKDMNQDSSPCIPNSDNIEHCLPYDDPNLSQVPQAGQYRELKCNPFMYQIIYESLGCI